MDAPASWAGTRIFHIRSPTRFIPHPPTPHLLTHPPHPPSAAPDGPSLQAYLSVAPRVAAFPEYFEALAWHLLRSKLRHWEKGLRELAAQALAGAPQGPVGAVG